ncbi:MAG: hypothetical protein KDI12_17390, partial [Anaerolineae bacterium]|nr:hypothetical protein [Anaerolineae bacterium]
ALGYPGQTDAGVQAFNYARGMLDLSLEHGVLDEVSPAPVTSVIAVLDQAELDGVPISRYTIGTLDELNALPISAQAKARISTALTENPDLNVLVPEAMVTVPGASAPTIGWLLLDNDTLETIDVMENGLHMAVSYAVLGNFAKKVGSLVGGFGAGFVATTMGFWGSFFGAVPIDPADIGSVMAQAKRVAAEKGKESEKACKAKADKKWCKAGVQAGAAAGNAAINRADPPLPEMQLNLPFEVTYPTTSASAVVNQTANLTGNAVAVNVTTPLVGVHRSTSEAWASNAQNNLAFDNLWVADAQVYQGATLLGSGTVSAAPASAGSPAVATTDSSAIDIDATATGSLSLHGPVSAQLAAGSNRDSYTADLSGVASFELALRDAVVNVGGNDYSGDLRLVTSETVNVIGSGRTAAPNFAASLLVNTSNGGFTAADASGTATVGGAPVLVASGFALGDAVGTGSVTGAAGDDDTFVFNGTADFYRLGLSSNASGTPAGGSTSFSAVVSANVSDAYTMTVYGPAGWDVSIDSSGLIDVQSPVDAAAGAHEIVVFAQPAGAPDLAVSAVHVVTVSPVDGVQLDVFVDPTFTVPWGDTVPGVYDLAVNDGRMQLTGASFAVDLTNTSSVARTFDVNVTGLPAGWSILGSTPGATGLAVPLQAGQKVQLGLHILPTVTTLPAIGTNYPFTVVATAQDNGAVTASDSDSWTLPAVPFPFVQVSPAEQYLGENSASSFEVTLTNVGNAPGSFDLLAESPAAGWTVSPPTSPVALNPGQSSTQTLNFSVTTGQRNVDYPFVVSSPAPTIAYTPTTAMLVYLAGPLSAPVYEAGSDVLACTDDSALAAAFTSLAGAASELEASCDGGTCSNALRDSAVSAAGTLVSLVNANWPAVSTAAVVADASALASASGTAAIGAALQDLGDSAAALGVAVCQSAEHQPAAQFTPSIDAVLLGGSATYTLTVTNEGSVATTYAVTTTLPTGPDYDSLSLDPGESQPVVYNVTAPALGFQVLEAHVVATGPDVVGTISDDATAGLNVVNQFVQITSLTPDPPFVETGVSSTAVSIEVANVANLRREVTARTTFSASGGGAIFTDDTPLTIQPGAPQSYALQTVNTSGWASGVYTVEVELLDASLAPVPDGYGFAPFGVGQALGASHSVSPMVVAPGDVTVTTVITTEILVDTILPEQPALPPMEPRNVRSGEQWIVTKEAGGEVFSAADTAPASLTLTPTLALRERVAEPETEPDPLDASDVEAGSSRPPTDDAAEEVVPDNSRSPLAAPTREEQSGAGFVYSGSWQTITSNRASGNNYIRSQTAGNTVSYDFDGTWVKLGLLGTSISGEAEVFLDGASQGVIDTYRREDTAFALTFEGLISTTHTISLTMLGTANPKSGNEYVGIDYIDTWDGAALPDGLFEQTDPRVLLSGSWVNINDANASGGSYYRSNNGNAWFYFSGDSFTYHAMTRNDGRTVRLYVDSVYLTELELFDWSAAARTFSFQGFGPGLHVVQVSSQNGYGTVDAFAQPGSAPWTDPNPPPASFQRYEADSPAWLYNGEPYTLTARTWTRETNATSRYASDAESIWSNTASDSAAITFDGSWAAVGFMGDSDGGNVEVFLDGVSQGVVDTYRREVEPLSFTVGNLTLGTHTISLTVVGDGEVRVDFLDVWDGAALSDGTFEPSAIDRYYLDDDWSLRTSINPPGQFLRTGSGNAWFPFTGDTVSFQAWGENGTRKLQLYVDDSYKGTFDIEAAGTITPTWSFDGLGAGAHVLRVHGWQANATIAAFIQPGGAPFYTPPAIGAFHRYEDDWPAILYNGQPFTTTVTNWSRVSNIFATAASNGQYIWSGTVGDTVSFDFSGVKVGAGFFADRFGGNIEILIDGNSQGVFDSYRTDPDFLSIYYDGLAPGPHTLTLNLLGASHPNSSGARLYLDYIDVWDGTPLPDGWFEQDDSRVLRSNGWDTITGANASGGTYGRDGLYNGANAWFPFSGDSVTYQAMALSNGDEFAIAKIDGEFAGYLNLYSSTTMTRTYSFEGLGAGLHVLQIQRNRSELTMDGFQTPGSAPFFTP